MGTINNKKKGILGFILFIGGGIFLATLPGFLVFWLWLDWSLFASILCGFLVGQFLLGLTDFVGVNPLKMFKDKAKPNNHD